MGNENKQVVSPTEWRSAREKLRAKEKELARMRDALVAERRKLPVTRVDKDYVFEGPSGTASLLDLFDGRGQLLVYHFWFVPGESPCGGCSLWVSNLGNISNLHERDTSLVLVSPAAPAEIEAVRLSRGWTVPWFSLAGNEFNDDMDYVGEPRITVFIREGGSIFRTYATSGRDLEQLSTHWTLLDLTPRED